MIISTCPLRMLVRMNVILGMRHQAEYVALWIANPCNVMDGAVRVEGIFVVRRRAVGISVNKGELIIFDERGKRKKFGCLEVAFTMGNWAFNELIQILSPNTFLRNGFESHPAAFEMTLCIEG